MLRLPRCVRMTRLIEVKEQSWPTFKRVYNVKTGLISFACPWFKFYESEKEKHKTGSRWVLGGCGRGHGETL